MRDDGNKTGMYVNMVLLRKQKEADPTEDTSSR